MTFKRIGLVALSTAALLSTPSLAAKYSHDEFVPVITSFAQARTLAFETLPQAANSVSAAGWDAWIDGRYLKASANVGETYGFIGTVGASTKLNDSVTVGGFVAVDRLAEFRSEWTSISGTGVLFGPSLSARLTDEISLDVLAGIGFAEYVSDDSHEVAKNRSTRAYVNAALNGEFGEGALKFTPRLGVSYSGEWTGGVVSGSDVFSKDTISATVVYGGPGVTYTIDSETLKGAVSARADVRAPIGQNKDITVGVSASASVFFENGMALTAGVSYAGIGSSDRAFAATLSLSGRF